MESIRRISNGGSFFSTNKQTGTTFHLTILIQSFLSCFFKEETKSYKGCVRVLGGKEKVNRESEVQ